ANEPATSRAAGARGPPPHTPLPPPAAPRPPGTPPPPQHPPPPAAPAPPQSATAPPAAPAAPAKRAAPKKTVAAKPPAAAPQPAAPTAPPVVRVYTPRERLFMLRTSCGGDVRAFCPGIPLRGGRLIACLPAHGPSLPPNCQSAMAALAR